MKRDRQQKATEQLLETLGLSEDAVEIAQGWSLLPDTLQRHVKILIDDYLGRSIPSLRDLYANSSHADQLRFNRLVEAAQARIRGNDVGES